MLEKQVAATIQAKIPDTTHPRTAIRHAAEIVSLQVLRDALLPKDESSLPQPSSANGGASKASKTQRSGSVSVAYPAMQGRQEVDLGPLVSGRLVRDGAPALRRNSGDEADTVKNEEEDRAGGMVDVQSGKELVLLCRQNSLLPGVLELLQSGLPTSATGGQSGQGGVSGVRSRNGSQGNLMGLGTGTLERNMSKRGGGGRV